MIIFDKMKISGIYQIQSKIKPERIYIGSAINIQQRWWVHLCELRKNEHGNNKLQRHFNKYGEIDLQFSVLLGCDKQYLIANEQFFIDSYKPFFNIRKQADSNLGIKRTKETRRKLSIAHEGQISGAKGKKWSKEACEKQRGENNPMWRIGEKHPMFGKHHSEESNRKNSESHKDKKASIETRKKMSESSKKAWINRKLKIA